MHPIQSNQKVSYYSTKKNKIKQSKNVLIQKQNLQEDCSPEMVYSNKPLICTDKDS